MLEKAINAVQAFVANPLVGFASAIIVLVVANKMSASAYWSNTMLGLAWAILITSTFRTPIISDQPILPRSLWTMFFAASFGLALFYVLWEFPKSVSDGTSGESSDTFPEPDTAELANTTRYQEAVIIDAYHHIAGAERKGEVYALYEKIMRLDNPFPSMQKLSETSEIEDLIKRGILQQNRRLADKQVAPLQGATRTVVVGNVHLTRKGTSLARDLLYVREHPEIDLFRPIEP
jgi:hypothetical protein